MSDSVKMSADGARIYCESGCCLPIYPTDQCQYSWDVPVYQKGEWWHKVCWETHLVQQLQKEAEHEV